jgi:hypothetical protein
VVFQPLGFIARLAALVPRPRVNLTRYHGPFATNIRYRAQVIACCRSVADGSLDSAALPAAAARVLEKTRARSGLAGANTP